MRSGLYWESAGIRRPSHLREVTMRRKILLSGFVVLAACQSQTGQLPPSSAVDDVAGRYYAWTLERQPEQAYFAAIALERHDGL